MVILPKKKGIMLLL